MWGIIINKKHMGVSKNKGTQNGWFRMENLIKIDDLGIPLFLETPIFLDPKVSQQFLDLFLSYS